MSTNPFFSQADAPPVETEEEPDPLLGRRLAVVGPPVPPGTARVPRQPVLERQNVARTALLWVVGLHGGAAASSIAALLGDEVAESPRAWPVNPYLQPQVLLVARTHAAGLAAAENALHEWAALAVPDTHLLGLVLVDDAPRVARPLVPIMNRVLHSAPRGWHVSWQEDWRVRTATDDRSVSLRTRRTLSDIRRRALNPPRPAGPADPDHRPCS